MILKSEHEQAFEKLKSLEQNIKQLEKQSENAEKQYLTAKLTREEADFTHQKYIDATKEYTDLETKLALSVVKIK